MHQLIAKVVNLLDPHELFLPHLNEISEDADLIAVGKPAALMAKSLAELKKFNSILVYTKKGHKVKADFTQWEGDHPIPSKENKAFTQALKMRLRYCKKLVFINTGGASSLIVDPKIPWKDFILIWKAMLYGGWGIEEMNQIRILMSKVKGGGLLSSLSENADVVNFYVSDVPKNHFEYVSSSPTNPVLLVEGNLRILIAKFESQKSQNLLNRCLEEYVPVNFNRLRNRLLLSADGFRARVAHILEQEFPDCEIIIDAEILSEPFELFLNRIPSLGPKQIWVSCGEALVTLKAATGVGGRNSHLVAIMQERLAQNEVFLSFATDGNDGNSPFAGGFIRAGSVQKHLLKRAIDSYSTASLLDEYGLAFKSPQGITNLMDLRIKFSL